MRGLRAAERTETTARELLLAALAGCLLAVVMNWPLLLHLGETIPKDLGDPLPQSWQVAWGGYALGHQPLDFFQSNQFWPLDDTLAFSDALLGYAPAGLIGSGPEDAATRYDLLFLFAYALCFFGAYLLARELGLGPGGAAIAGVAFAFAPFRLEQDGHLHVISSGGIALALAVGLRGFRRRRPWTVFAAFAIATWQFSLGPSLGLPWVYLLALLGAIAAVFWWRRGRPPLPRGMVFASVAGAALLLVSAALIARPYMRVADEQPDAERPPSTVEAFSDSPQVFAVAPDENLIWGGATSAIRDELQNPQEKTLFPGLAILALAIAGLVAGPLGRGVRIGLGIGVAGTSVLALGFYESGGLPVAVPDRLRALTGVGRDPHAREAVHVREPGTGPARGRRRGRRLAGAAGPGAATRGAVGGGRRRRAGGARDRGRGPRAAVRPDRQPRAAPGAAGAR